MTYPSNTTAFKLADLLPIIRKHGLTLDAEKRVSIEALTPQYAKNFIYSRHITKENAALILCGVDPSSEYYDSNGFWQDSTPVRGYDKFFNFLDEGQSQTILKVTSISPLMFLQEQIREWCASNGFYWPIPSSSGGVQALGNKNHSLEVDKLQKQLEDVTSQLKEQEASSKFLREITQERDNLREENTNLKTNLFDLEVDLDIALEKVTILENDKLAGKSRSFMLELLGGLVTSVLYVDIFKKGNIEVGTVTSVLEQVGLKPTPETVSRYLKEAATRLTDSEKAETIIKYLENKKGR